MKWKKFCKFSCAVVLSFLSMFFVAQAEDEFVAFLAESGLSINLNGELSFEEVVERYPQFFHEISDRLTGRLLREIELVEKMSVNYEAIEAGDHPRSVYVDAYQEVFEESVHLVKRLSFLNPKGASIVSAVDQYRSQIEKSSNINRMSQETIDELEGIDDVTLRLFRARELGTQDAKRHLSQLLSAVRERLQDRPLQPTTILLGKNIEDEELYLVLGFKGEKKYFTFPLVHAYGSDLEVDLKNQIFELSNGYYLYYDLERKTTVNTLDVVKRLQEVSLNNLINLSYLEKGFVQTHAVALLRLIRWLDDDSIANLGDLFFQYKLTFVGEGEEMMPALVHHTKARVNFFPTSDTFDIPWARNGLQKTYFSVDSNTTLAPGHAVSSDFNVVLTRPGGMAQEFNPPIYSEDHYDSWKRNMSHSFPLQRLLIDLFGLPFVLKGDYNLTIDEKAQLVERLKDPESGLLSFKELDEEEFDLLEQLPLDVLEQVKNFATWNLISLPFKRMMSEVLAIATNIEGPQPSVETIKLRANPIDDKLRFLESIKKTCQKALVW